MVLLNETYADKVVGTLSCFDRVIITGSLVDIAYAEAMARRCGSAGFASSTTPSSPSRCAMKSAPTPNASPPRTG